ncbi:MAG TPA: hypothetical protein VJ022_13915, partial [Anaerolineales bacterium]|nr:hypothetical protein [Anaerolineales bacterium]
MTKKSSSVSKAVKRGVGKKDSSQRSAISDQIISQVRELAWTGQHAQAIDIATQELSKAHYQSAPRMDLLDLRAESCIAQGKLDLAAKDAKAMMKLAKGGLDAPSRSARAARPPTNRKSKIVNRKLEALALNRQALVQMRRGDLKAAVKTATAAVWAKYTSPILRAQSLLRLSEAQWRVGQNEAAVETAQKAIPLFQTMGDNSGAGRAYWSQANARFNLSRAEDSRRAAQTALELCRQAGDQYGIGNALNAITLTDVDIHERIQHTQQALQAFEMAGYIERQTIALGNLALTYLELGLYPHSRRLQSEVVETTRDMGAKLSLAYGLGNLSEVEIKLGEFDSARAHLKELAEQVSTLGDSFMDSSLATGLGFLALSEGAPKTAIRHYKSAAQIAHQAGLGSENIPLTLLGQAHLANADPITALKDTKKATDMHRAQSFAKPDGFSSQEIWWRHTQALLANKKTKEAREALERAHGFLFESIVNLGDEGLRRNYLNKVAVNHELLQFWVKDGAKRKLPRERLFAHLVIESNVREPFKRLADTGLRLNALHTVAEIQTFLVEEATELSGGERVVLIQEKNGKRAVTDSILPRGEEAQKVLRSIDSHLNQARLTR